MSATALVSCAPAARRIIVECAFGRLFLVPGVEVAQLVIWRNVDAVASGDEFLDRGAGRQIGEKALCRRFVRRKIPDAPKAEIAWVEATFRAARRVEGP